MSESMMYILLAIIAVLTVAEIVMAVLLIAWRTKLNEEADSMHRYTDHAVNLYRKTREYEKQLSERMLIFAEKCDHQTEIYEEFCNVAKQIIDQNERIVATHGDIVDKYNDIAKSHNTLLAAQKEWYKGIDDRYSQGYEQFKLCADKLKELSYQITDLANVSTDDEYTLTLGNACDTVCLDCPYDSCHEDYCPVYQLAHRKEVNIEIEDNNSEKTDHAPCKWEQYKYIGDNTKLVCACKGRPCYMESCRYSDDQFYCPCYIPDANANGDDNDPWETQCDIATGR